MKLKEIDLFITEKCNLQCSFCSINADFNSKNELKYETVKEFIEFCKKKGVTDIHITGGEPTLHSNYKEIIQLILKNKIDARLITNGLVVTKDDLADLKGIGLKKIMFSLDGLEIFHNLVRGKNTYSKTMTAIYNAIKAEFHVRVNTVAWNENLNDIVGLMKYLNDIGVETHSIFLGSPVGRAKQLSNLSFVDDKNWMAFLIKLKNYYVSHGMKIRVVVERGYASRVHDVIDFNNIRSCSSIINNTDYLTVRANGNIYPCVFFNEDYQSIGNIYDLDNIDMGDTLTKSCFYRSVSNLPDTCKDCDDSQFCKGGCRGFNNSTYDTLKDIRCSSGEFMPICPLIKMDLMSDTFAPCTDDLTHS